MSRRGRPTTRAQTQAAVDSILEANAVAALRFIVDEGKGSSATSGDVDFIAERQPGRSAGTNEVRNFFSRAIDYTLAQFKLNPDSQLQVEVGDSDFQHLFRTEFKIVRTLDVDEILDELMRKMTSNTEVKADDMIVHITWVRRHRGRGVSSLEFNEYCKSKRCIIRVDGSDGNCFYHALALGYLYHADKEAYKTLAKTNLTAMKRRETARLLRERVGVHSSGVGVAPEECAQVEALLGVALYVVRYPSLEFLFESRQKGMPAVTLIFGGEMNQMHYNYVVTHKVGSLWDRRKFCYQCMKGYRNNAHRCIKVCYACMTTECVGAGKSVHGFTLTCGACHLKFANESCMRGHKCGSVRCCPKCQLTYKVKKEKGRDTHRCNVFRCRFCKEDVHEEEQHICYHAPLRDEELSKDGAKPIRPVAIYYDYECTIDEDGVHEVAMICAELETEQGFVEQFFASTREFVDWLRDLPTDVRGPKTPYVCIAHNSSRYDFHFVKRELLAQKIKTNDVVNGRKYMCSTMKDRNIRFIDSCRFIPLALRSFPKTFGIEHVAKGFFPYRFFKPSNKHYKGPMPPEYVFDFQSMKAQEHAVATQWYKEHQHETIDLWEMCKEYCKDDVRLLREGCERFREQFIKITDGWIYPFSKITIASLCMSIYRRQFLPEKTITKLPEYTRPYCEDRIEWVKWIEEKEHFSSTQLSVHGVKVDALDDERNVAYIFSECARTGCPKCFQRYTQHGSLHVTMFDLRGRFLTRLQKLRDAGVTVVTMDQCTWLYKKRHDPALRQYARRVKHTAAPLRIRDAFFGGRTEPIKLYARCGPDEVIEYFDFTSLYPACQNGEFRGLTPETYGGKRIIEYPVGPYQVIRDHFKPLTEYFGFVKCKIRSPKDLHLPFLPERRDGKLMFDLYDKVGTWTTIEVNYAVTLGYVVEEIYEVVHYPERSSTLFSPYVKTFLKMKEQAKGWKRIGAHTSEERKTYVEDYRREMGIELSVEEIGEEFNPGMYYIAKLCLNSLWGKFAQNTRFSQTQDTFTVGAFNKIMFDDTKEITSVIVHDHCGNNTRSITYRKRDEFSMSMAHTNVAIAAFTTAHARMRLYEALRVLNLDVIYMDTDSVVFRRNVKDPPKVCVGKYLGDFTNELKPGDWIVEFASTGPKSYAYKTYLGDVVVKMKGFTLDMATSEIINFDSVCELVFGVREEVVTSRLLFITDALHNMRTTFADKRYKATFNKRVRKTFDGKDVSTRPFKKRRVNGEEETEPGDFSGAFQQTGGQRRHGGGETRPRFAEHLH